MAEAKRLFILAGEPSGDGLAADLVRRLRARTAIEISGVGGSELAAEGLRSLFPMSDLAVMGWADVLPRLPLLLWRARQVAHAIIAQQPDVVVLVDAQVFSQTVAKRVRDAGVKLPILLYVSPSVWAWGPERAQRLNGLYDEVLGILPFEPGVMKTLGGPPTSFVGHPAPAKWPFRETLPEKGPLLILPGSRPGEIRRHKDLLRKLAERFGGHPRVTSLIVPTVPALEARLKHEFRALPVDVVSDPAAKRAAFGAAIAAAAAMGTITLELAVAGVPMVTFYFGDRGQLKRVLKYRIRYVSLPNLVLDRPLVPEEIYPEPESVIGYLQALLDKPEKRADQLAGFRAIRAQMAEGLPDTPRVDAVDRVLAHLSPQRRSIGS